MSGMDARHNNLLLTKRAPYNIARLWAADAAAIIDAACHFPGHTGLPDARWCILSICGSSADVMSPRRCLIYSPHRAALKNAFLSRTAHFNGALPGTAPREHQSTNLIQRLACDRKTSKRAGNACNRGTGVCTKTNTFQYFYARSSYLPAVKPGADIPCQQRPQRIVLVTQPGYSATAVTLSKTCAAVPFALTTSLQQESLKAPPFAARCPRLTATTPGSRSAAASRINGAAPVLRLPAAAGTDCCRGKARAAK